MCKGLETKTNCESKKLKESSQVKLEHEEEGVLWEELWA